MLVFFYHSDINKYRSVANFSSMTNTGKENCQPEHCMSDCIRLKQFPSVLVFLINHKEPCGRSVVRLSGLAMSVPITNDDKARIQIGK